MDPDHRQPEPVTPPSVALPSVNVSYPGSDIVGTCSQCGGPMLNAKQWYGSQPQTPSCGYCGARPKPTINPIYGPIIETTKL